MESGAFLYILAFVIAFAAVSKLLERTVITGPMCFVAFGMLMGSSGLDLLGMDVQQPVAHALAEITLVLVLFTDAARIDLRVLRRELGLPVRLLGIGMPLTVIAGALVAAWVFPAWGMWEAVLLAVILAPTDAALGQAVVSSEAIPMRMRQTLNVESGLNDGLALPGLLVAIALAAGGAGEDGRSTAEWLTYAAKQVTLGPLAGVAVGLAGSAILGRASARGWMNDSFYKLSGLALALMAYGFAEAIGGNGFIAAFVGGMTLGNTSRGLCGSLYGFLEAEGQLLMLLVFMLLGSALALPALEQATGPMFLYALLSLTVLRMLPVALSLAGAGLRSFSTLFLGWFGPRGLASLLYGLLILEEAEIAHGQEIFTVVLLTVLFSVFLHGISAVPGSRAYARAISAAQHADAHEHRPVAEHPFRHGP